MSLAQIAFAEKHRFKPNQAVVPLEIFGYNKPEEAEAALRRDFGAMIQV
jgi:hypothetical protein